MKKNTTGGSNSGVSAFALNSNTTGGNNTALGNNSLLDTQTGSSNTAVGEAAGKGVAANSFSNNSLFGFQSGFGLSTGSNNLLFGSNAGSTTATGANNIAIGYDVALPIPNGSNQLDIGNLIFGTGINGEGTNISTGNIAIGTSTPYSRLTVWGSDAASSTLAFNVVNNASSTVFAVFDGGNAQLSGTLTQSSDRRLKTNITALDASSSLASINSLTPAAYDWLDPEKGGVRQYGFIAQQVQQVFPNLVSTTSATALTPDGTLGLNYLGLIAPLVEAVQSLSRDLTSLEATVAGFADPFTSKKITASQELCVGATCVTETQLQALLSATPSVQISAPTPPVISGTSTPPSIDIQGSNPAVINIGDLLDHFATISIVY